MPDRGPGIRGILRRLVPFLGVALLGYLVSTANLRSLAANARAIGWGILLVFALAGFSHVIKAWAWRLTLRGEARNVFFAHALALRLISEAIGQFGVFGMVLGETTRVSLLGDRVSTPNAISSVTLDRAIFIMTGAIVTIAGLVGVVFGIPLSHAVRVYAVGLGLCLVILPLIGVIAVHRKWPLLSGPARLAARVPWLRNWTTRQEATLKNTENKIIAFCHETPLTFWSVALLNLGCHLLAVAEVYLILRLLGVPVPFLGALILESLTKLINAFGALNPGNVGTYEGGNMVIGRLFSLTAAQGLLLALCRRARALFWAVIGGICLVWFTRTKRSAQKSVEFVSRSSKEISPSRDMFTESKTILVLAHGLPHQTRFEPALAQVGSLPVLLRVILSAVAAGPARMVVVVNPVTGSTIQAKLQDTGRLPKNIEWLEVPVGMGLSPILRTVGSHSSRVEIISGTSSYHPELFHKLRQWDGLGYSFELLTAGAPTGLAALSHEAAADLADGSESWILDGEQLHHWIAANVERYPQLSCEEKEIEGRLWHAIACEEDRQAAEHKLDGWLTKSTDGVFARMNRRVSIPISRLLIKYPITPNMVTFFTLAVSIASGAFFMFGGYWNGLIGAVLSVCGSILDGCDGEVARLKLQSTKLGSWLDTICDYVFYIVTFAGITIGLVRSECDLRYFDVGTAVFVGAILTFTFASLGRKRLSGARPEKYLEVWQKNAEKRSAGLLVNAGRYTEFIVRRCFLPYLLFVMAVFHALPVFLYMAAFGANVAWIVSLRSLIAFSPKHTVTAPDAPSSRSGADNPAL